MLRLFAVGVLLCISAFAHAHEALPPRVIGRMPDAASPALYRLQVGAFQCQENAAEAFCLLRNSGFYAVFENFRGFTRVIVPGIPANEIIASIQRLGQLGFCAIIVSEDRAARPFLTGTH